MTLNCLLKLSSLINSKMQDFVDLGNAMLLTNHHRIGTNYDCRVIESVLFIIKRNPGIYLTIRADIVNYEIVLEDSIVITQYYMNKESDWMDALLELENTTGIASGIILRAMKER